MDSSTQDPSFSVGLQGVAGGSEEFERIEQVIMDTLQQVATTGFTREHVEAAIHQLELSLRDVSHVLLY